MVTIDPTVNLELSALGGRHERVATPIEAAELIAAIPDEDRALWATAAYAGLRRGELRALQASNVRAGAITVAHGWDDMEGSARRSRWPESVRSRSPQPCA